MTSLLRCYCCVQFLSIITERRLGSFATKDDTTAHVIPVIEDLVRLCRSMTVDKHSTITHSSRRTEHGSGDRSYRPSSMTTATSRSVSPGFRVYAHSAPRVACRRGLAAGSPTASKYAALNRCLFGSLSSHGHACKFIRAGDKLHIIHWPPLRGLPMGAVDTATQKTTPKAVSIVCSAPAVAVVPAEVVVVVDAHDGLGARGGVRPGRRHLPRQRRARAHVLQERPVAVQMQLHGA